MIDASTYTNSRVFKNFAPPFGVGSYKQGIVKYNNNSRISFVMKIIESVYFTTAELPSGAGTVNFLGEGVDHQLRRIQLIRAPNPTDAHCDTVNSIAIFVFVWEKKVKKRTSMRCCHFDRCSSII